MALCGHARRGTLLIGQCAAEGNFTHARQRSALPQAQKWRRNGIFERSGRITAALLPHCVLRYAHAKVRVKVTAVGAQAYCGCWLASQLAGPPKNCANSAQIDICFPSESVEASSSCVAHHITLLQQVSVLGTYPHDGNQPTAFT